MAALKLGLNKSFLYNNHLRNGFLAISRTIKTSGEKKETITVKDFESTAPRTAEDFADLKSQKNWVSYGFDFSSEKEDRSIMHWTFFFSVTIALVCGGFVMTYLPDIPMNDWSSREAFLELHRREKAGLVLIDRNYIDPAKIKLPSEEELGDTEIYL